MWLGILVIATLIAALVMPRMAKADILMPINGMEKVSEPAQITEFTKNSSPALIEERCHALLSPIASATKNQPSLIQSSRIWRNASIGEGQKIDVVQAVKAYRQCARTVALEELAKY
ncbi:MAG: hypothetical protein RBR86_07045 [Pseudobdellovibrionaceae bacterium]|nr:hypothetical protein [Pseudobdellovibrionaceae bacterium]